MLNSYIQLKFTLTTGTANWNVLSEFPFKISNRNIPCMLQAKMLEVVFSPISLKVSESQIGTRKFAPLLI